jgi:hypothetical protein
LSLLSLFLSLLFNSTLFGTNVLFGFSLLKGIKSLKD